MRQPAATPNIPTDCAMSGASAASDDHLLAHENDNPASPVITINGKSMSNAETQSPAPMRPVDVAPSVRPMNRGLTATIPPTYLQHAIRRRALSLVNRFRVIRTIDVALECFPERPFKAALTAAQRAMRTLVKAKLILRYRTDRFQHVYGLTEVGARWLEDEGIGASASVRRVSDMTNPEHTLWMNFVALACQARGLQAHTEGEAMRQLNRGAGPDAPVIQGFIEVAVGDTKRLLRPDALAYEADGDTWFEIDRSKRSADRERALGALVARIGGKLKNGNVLRRVVVHAKSERIYKRALAVMHAREKQSGETYLIQGGRAYTELEEGIFEVRALMEQRRSSGRSSLNECVVGHVILQLLPIWLPKVRIDAKNRHSTSGWISENYLPYRRHAQATPWFTPTSPLSLTPMEAAV
jgi:hypothetical protein